MSQQAFSEELNIPRTTLGDYEREKTEPNISTLIQMSKFFKVPIDKLLKENLSLDEYQIINTEGFKVLAISVNDINEGNIELVDSKAEAGYLDSYQNPEYIKDLPKFQLPNIPKGTYRAFEIQGDSMLPIQSGSIIIASYVEKLSEIKNDKTYIVISHSEGLVYKRIKCDPINARLILSSDNETYLPYDLAFREVAEVWQYYGHLSFNDSKASVINKLESKIGEMHLKINQIHKKVLKD